MSNLTKNARRHTWALDFSTRRQGDRTLSPTTDLQGLGYQERSLQEAGARDANPDLVAKKSWDIALGPLKQIPMNLFIMWMAGNSISIFPIMMVGMMFIRPCQALLCVQQTFKMIEGSFATLQKITYLFGNIVGLALAIYKCQVMGLLPTHPSDWLAFVQPQTRLEWSGGGVAF